MHVDESVRPWIRIVSEDVHDARKARDEREEPLFVRVGRLRKLVVRFRRNPNSADRLMRVGRVDIPMDDAGI